MYSNESRHRAAKLYACILFHVPDFLRHFQYFNALLHRIIVAAHLVKHLFGTVHPDRTEMPAE